MGSTTTYHYNNGMLLSETTGEETLRYYYDSTGKAASVIHETADGKETGYFYTRNAQGDIIGIYRSSDSKLMGSYEYDLWGRLISITPTVDDTTGITEKNPYRYRSYYYDEETGFYYLNARYYDPQIRRFISADSMNALMIATTDVGCKNLFCYAENNPVTNKDGSGNFVESAFDLVTLAGSIVEVCVKPTDPWAWAGLAGDAIDLIPCVTGVGEAVKALKATAKTAEMADTVTDAIKVADKVKDATKASSKALRNNMVKAGIEAPEYANAAHHIVAGKASGAADARAVLKKFNIGINDATNGVFLPTKKGVSNAMYHPDLHTNTYYNEVNEMMSKATSKEDALDILYEISNGLKNGTFIK